MINFSNKHIEFFLEAARTLSFSQSADNLFTAQSTVSRTIKQLEDEIDATLFYRERFSLALTPAGEYLFHELERIQDDIANALEHAKFLSHQYTNELRIGVYSYSLLDKIYQSVLRDFEQQHPEIITSYSLNDMGDERLKSKKLDLLIMPNFSFEQRDQYHSIPVEESSLFLLCNYQNPIAQRGRLTAEDFKQQKILTVYHPQMLRRIHEETFAFYNVCNTNILKVENSDDLLVHLRQDNCFTLMDNYCMSIDTGNFFRYELPEPCSHVSLSLYWAETNENPSLKRFLDYFQSQE